jgi:hypothetical protein
VGLGALQNLETIYAKVVGGVFWLVDVRVLSAVWIGNVWTLAKTPAIC